MGLFFIICSLITFLTTDIIFYLFVPEWGTQEIINITFLNLSFILFLIFTAISPRGSYEKILGVTAILESSGYIVACSFLIIGSLFVNCDTLILLVVHTVLLLIAILASIYNYKTNLDTALRDKKTRVASAENRGLADDIYAEVKIATNKDVKNALESTYDALRCRTHQSNSDFSNDLIETLVKRIVVANRNGDNDETIRLCLKLNEEIRNSNRQLRGIN